jgi:subtilisin family serine protease
MTAGQRRGRCTALGALLLILPMAWTQAANIFDYDLNGDGLINPRDAMVLRQCMNAPASCNPTADFNDDGVINVADFKDLAAHYGQPLPTAGVSINGETDVTITEGGSVNVIYSVELQASAAGSYGISWTDADAPAGVGFSNDAGNTFPATLADSSVLLINETITGDTVGEYQLVKTVALEAPAGSAELVVNVRVVPGSAPVVLSEPGAQPGGIPVGVATDVTFTVALSGTDAAAESVVVNKVDVSGNSLGQIAALADDGVAPDAAAGDGIYTGSASLLGSSAGFITIQARAALDGSDYGSPYREIAVTDVPITFPSQAPTADNTEIDPGTNSLVIKNQLLVEVAPGVLPDQAEAAVENLGFSVMGYEPALGSMLIGVPAGTSLADAKAQIEALPELGTAEPNGVQVLTAFTPNDPSYASQWGFPRTRADEAWVIGRGNAVVVAVLDTGVDLDHPDLQANIWSGSVPNPAGGPAVTASGYDFVDDDFLPDDSDGHGTHVAGTIAAISNNGSQVAGMAPNAKIMAIRFLGPNGGSWSDFAAGLRLATDLGAKIVNVSAGGGHSVVGENAVKYAADRGVLVVAAAGNGATSATTYSYPAAYDEAMAIGSTDSADGRSGFSNYGIWVDMAAPGSGILSTWVGGGTAQASGTSMATPHVAGAAALLWGQNPSMTAAEVRNRLKGTASPLPAALQLGRGRLDVFNALFNGSFELNLDGWEVTGTASSVTALGPLTPTRGARMAFVSTGPAGDNIDTAFAQSFTVQPGVSSIPVQFSYNFVTEEYPEYVGSVFNDCVELTLQTPSGELYSLAHESVNGSIFTPITGIDLPGGDNTVGMTGWKTVALDVPVGEGPGEYRLYITDRGDDIYDSVLLLDDIGFEATAATLQTPALGTTCSTTVDCDAFPDDPQCGGWGGGDYCELNPYDPGCPYCMDNPWDPQCGGGGGGDYCELNPYDPGCPYCMENPGDPACGGSVSYCLQYPYAAGCPGYCAQMPLGTPECGDYPESCWIFDLSAPGCPAFCLYNPLDPSCPSYNGNGAQCMTPTDPNCQAYCAEQFGVVWDGWLDPSSPPICVLAQGCQTGFIAPDAPACTDAELFCNIPEPTFGACPAAVN